MFTSVEGIIKFGEFTLQTLILNCEALSWKVWLWKGFDASSRQRHLPTQQEVVTVCSNLFNMYDHSLVPHTFT